MKANSERRVRRRIGVRSRCPTGNGSRSSGAGYSGGVGVNLGDPVNRVGVH